MIHYISEFNYEEYLAPLYNVLGSIATERDALALVKGARICGYHIPTDGVSAWLTRDEEEYDNDIIPDDQLFWDDVEQSHRWEEAQAHMIYDK